MTKNLADSSGMGEDLADSEIPALWPSSWPSFEADIEVN